MRALVVALLLAASPAAAHGNWYGELKVPGTVTSCCNEQDCRPVDLCVLPDGREGLSIEGSCQPITTGAILRMPSPDGQTHVCLGHKDGKPMQRCVVLGGAS